MKLEEAKEKLIVAGYAIQDEKRLGNNTGTQLRLNNGAIVNIFDKGTISFQGVCPLEVKQALGIELPESTPSDIKHQKKETNREVFVVYGHDQVARNQLEVMLRRWGLEPLILDQLPSEGQTVIEKLEKYTKTVKFAVVLATPDDEGNRANHPDEMAFRARQNVVLELGMMLSLLGRKNVAILLKQQENMERPSDIQGLIYIPFKDNLQVEAGPLLAKEMAAQGYHIDVRKL